MAQATIMYSHNVSLYIFQTNVLQLIATIAVSLVTFNVSVALTSFKLCGIEPTKLRNSLIPKWLLVSIGNVQFNSTEVSAVIEMSFNSFNSTFNCASQRAPTTEEIMVILFDFLLLPLPLESAALFKTDIFISDGRRVPPSIALRTKKLTKKKTVDRNKSNSINSITLTRISFVNTK